MRKALAAQVCCPGWGLKPWGGSEHVTVAVTEGKRDAVDTSYCEEEAQGLMQVEWVDTEQSCFRGQGWQAAGLEWSHTCLRSRAGFLALFPDEPMAIPSSFILRTDMNWYLTWEMRRQLFICSLRLSEWQILDLKLNPLPSSRDGSVYYTEHRACHTRFSN